MMSKKDKSNTDIKMKKAKVLYFVDRLIWGGIQSLLYDIVRYVDRDKIKLDVLVCNYGHSSDLERSLIANGINVRKLDCNFISNIRDIIPYIYTVRKFFKEHGKEYDVVHMNSSCKNVLILYYARKYGIKVRIAHSHNLDFQNRTVAAYLLQKVLTPLLLKVSTHFLACSKDAGIWMFGKEWVEKGNVQIIKNAIETDKFLFNEDWRKLYRQDLDIEDKTVYGCIGRFSSQKNHSFLLDVFAEIKKRQANAVLLLVGDGDLRTVLKKKANDLGVSDSILFLGFRTDRNKLLSAMDVFVLPSLFEGLGIVLIEAQASSLLSFTSKDVVPQEAAVSDLLKFLPLSASASDWAEKILFHELPDRKNMKHEIVKSRYDIEQMIEDITHIYLTEDILFK